MLIGLFTSRVVLHQLGEVNFGVYNVVAGVIVIFSFISNTLASSSSRFISFALGKSDEKDTRKIFSAIFTIIVLFGLIAILLAETVGLWYVYNYLKYPIQEKNTVLIIYQIAIITMLFNIVAIPFTSMIIAHERMNVYAYVTLIDVFAKLAIALSLVYIKHKLIFFTSLQCVTSFILLMLYLHYCKSKGFVKSIGLKYDKRRFKSILIYSGWGFGSSLTAVTSTQGINILLNYVFGVIMNTAYGLTMQVQNAIRSFSVSFQMALNPQLVKTYSSGDISSHKQLVLSSMKFSFFLILLIAAPIYANLTPLLDLWLGQYPEETITFVKWILLSTVFSTITNPLGVSVEATGRIGRMTAICSGVTILVLPVSWLWLKFSPLPEIPFVIYFASEVIVLLIKLHYAIVVSGITMKELFSISVYPMIRVGVLVTLSCLALSLIDGDSILLTMLRLILGCLAVATLSYVVGLKINERKKVWAFITSRGK